MLLGGETPSLLRTAEITPLPKPGKSHRKAEDFRPISLTSVIAKVYEKILAKRLLYYLEGRDSSGGPLLPTAQCGFRPGRSASDLVGFLTQQIFDGFNRSEGRPPQKLRSLLFCLDFAKAFDTVWKEGLFWKMFQLGLPGWLIRAVKSTLVDRKARVSIDGVTSPFRILGQGYHRVRAWRQSYLLSTWLTSPPLLPAAIVPSMYADDIALLSQASNIHVCAQQLQEGLNIVSTWSQRWHVRLEVSKSTVSLFSLNNSENCGKVHPHVYFPSTVREEAVESANIGHNTLEEYHLEVESYGRPVVCSSSSPYVGQLVVAINGREVHPSRWMRQLREGVNTICFAIPVAFVECPTYLGVKLDSTLSFRPFMHSLCTKQSHRSLLLQRLRSQVGSFSQTFEANIPGLWHGFMQVLP